MYFCDKKIKLSIICSKHKILFYRGIKMLDKEVIGDYGIKNEIKLNDLISKLKEENKKLRKENERLKSVADVVPCIVHDINNFLAPIVGSVEIVKDQAKNQPKILKSLEIIEKCANDGINVSSRLMKHLKGIETKDEGIHHIDEVVAYVIEIMHKKYSFSKYKIDFDVKTDSNALVKGNLTEIRELFINILNNSVDAINNNGHIWVYTKKEGKYVEIEIKDDGIGMNEETKQKIFNPYFTTKGEKGMGIGLHFCQKMVKKYGGSISCKSKLNVGTTFKVIFPCYEKENDIKDDDSKYDFHGNVLIVDDEKPLRDVVSEMVRTVINCNVKAVSSDEVLENTNVNEYSVIICDYLMPKINGIQLAELIKLKNPDVYFCLMTGWVGDFDHGKYGNIDDVLYKPINLKQIRKLFDSVQKRNS